MTSLPMLVLVRHGESAWNAQRRYQGHGDSELTAAGAAQAEELAAWLGPRLGCDVPLVSSDLARAHSTATPLARRLRVDVHFDNRLREIDVGRWSGRLVSEIAAEEPEIVAAAAAGDDVARGGGETFAQLRRRVETAIAELASDRDGSTTVVFTHGGPIRVAVAAALGIPAPGHDRVGEPGHCSMSEFELHNGRWRLLHFNRTPALDTVGKVA